jgi:hypothetical protein
MDSLLIKYGETKNSVTRHLNVGRLVTSVKLPLGRELLRLILPTCFQLCPIGVQDKVKQHDSKLHTDGADSGTIPSQVGLLTALLRFHTYGNLLNGTVPALSNTVVNWYVSF